MKILSISGFVPEQICDFVRFNGYSGDRNITNYCGYANDFISQVLNDDTIDGAVFPKSCDSTRIINSYLDGKKYAYQINVPARRDETSIVFFSDVIKNFRESLEERFGSELGDIKERSIKINERNNVIKEAYGALSDISYSAYLKSIHKMMKNPLMNSNSEISIKSKLPVKHNVFLVGSFLSNESIVEMIENTGLGIIGDNLPESGRIQGRQTEISDDMYLAISKEILGRNLSPTQNDFSSIIKNDIQEIKQKKCEAVIFVTQKYCEPYDYLYSIYKKKLDDIEVPSLRITLNDSEDDRKVKLLVEAFADML